MHEMCIRLELLVSINNDLSYMIIDSRKGTVTLFMSEWNECMHEMCIRWKLLVNYYYVCVCECAIMSLISYKVLLT